MRLTLGKEEYEVTYTKNPDEVTSALAKARAPFFTYDLETTGLHIKKDKPFLGAVCFNQEVWVFPSNQAFLSKLPTWSKLVRMVVGHNIGYDMHMTANIVGDEVILSIKNWADTMGMCRLTFEAVSTRDGGDKLGLKTVSKKYIDSKADYWEKEVKAWIKNKKVENRKVLLALLKGEKWTMKKFEDSVKNGTKLPENIQVLYQLWKEEYPEPNYQSVPMDIMLPYVATDVILTKILAIKCSPVIKNHKQEHILKQECELLPVVFKMERAGIKTDISYLEKCGEKIDSYIEKLYIELHELSGVEFKSGQHNVIKKLYAEWLDEDVKSTDKTFLKKMAVKENKLGQVASIISRLRRLEKWRSTYINRIIDVASFDGRFYTSMNPYNPVSGRFSGDFQQNPKEAILDEEGNELFSPRRAFVVSGNSYNHMYFLDFSQVELRMQSHYTLAFGGDVNLCRAYAPFKCVHYRTGEIYDYKDEQERKRWDEKQEDGKSSAWLIPETKEPWVETDVHSATTINALTIMGIDHTKLSPKEFKKWRSKGKMTNFLRNYGGSARACAEQLEVTLEEATALVNGYTKAFPLVITYQNKVIEQMQRKGYCINMSGRRYYVANSDKHYKVTNYLIQGSCADDLKKKMIQINTFLTENKYKTRMLLCVHDELIFEVYDGEEFIIPKIKEIMEHAPDVMIPIIAEVEKSNTCWADKKG